jgi:hypothetical protein
MRNSKTHHSYLYTVYQAQSTSINGTICHRYTLFTVYCGCRSDLCGLGTYVVDPRTLVLSFYAHSAKVVPCSLYPRFTNGTVLRPDFLGRGRSENIGMLKCTDPVFTGLGRECTRQVPEDWLLLDTPHPCNPV